MPAAGIHKCNAQCGYGYVKQKKINNFDQIWLFPHDSLWFCGKMYMIVDCGGSVICLEDGGIRSILACGINYRI